MYTILKMPQYHNSNSVFVVSQGLITPWYVIMLHVGSLNKLNLLRCCMVLEVAANRNNSAEMTSNPKYNRYSLTGCVIIGSQT
jgi:hypothetical protein